MKENGSNWSYPISLLSSGGWILYCRLISLYSFPSQSHASMKWALNCMKTLNADCRLLIFASSIAKLQPCKRKFQTIFICSYRCSKFQKKIKQIEDKCIFPLLLTKSTGGLPLDIYWYLSLRNSFSPFVQYSAFSLPFYLEDSIICIRLSLVDSFNINFFECLLCPRKISRPGDIWQWTRHNP